MLKPKFLTVVSPSTKRINIMRFISINIYAILNLENELKQQGILRLYKLTVKPIIC